MTSTHSIENKNQNNNYISYRQPALVAGLSIFAANPTGVLWYLGMAVSGIALSALTYVASSAAYEIVKTNQHLRSRVALPVLANTSQEFDNAFTTAFERIKAHPCYEVFKQHANLENDIEAFGLLKANLEEGYCYGSQICILQKLSVLGNNSPIEVLKTLKLEEIFYFQLLHNINGSFSGIHLFSHGKGLEWRVQKEVKSFSKENPGRDLKQQINMAHALRIVIPGLCKARKLIPLEGVLKDEKMRDTVRKEQAPWELEVTPFIPADKTPEIYRQTLEGLLPSKECSVYGVIETIGNEDTPDEGRNHAIGFHYSPQQCYFYDPISAREGGLFIYVDKAEFFKGLHKQIHSDYPSSKDFKFRFEFFTG